MLSRVGAVPFRVLQEVNKSASEVKSLNKNEAEEILIIFASFLLGGVFLWGAYELAKRCVRECYPKDKAPVVMKDVYRNGIQINDISLGPISVVSRDATRNVSPNNSIAIDVGGALNE